MFIPEQARKKVKNDLNKVFNEMRDGKIKMQVIAAEGKVQVVELSVNVLLNNLKMAEGIILSLKKITKP